MSSTECVCHRRGELRVQDAAGFACVVARLYRKDWVVYCKRPFGGSEQVIRYLGQYTHRVAISNHRLLTLDERASRFAPRAARSLPSTG